MSSSPPGPSPALFPSAAIRRLLSFAFKFISFGYCTARLNMAKSSFDVVDRPAPAEEETVDNGFDSRKVMDDTLTWSPEEERRALRKYVAAETSQPPSTIVRPDLTFLLGLISI